MEGVEEQLYTLSAHDPRFNVEGGFPSWVTDEGHTTNNVGGTLTNEPLLGSVDVDNLDLVSSRRNPVNGPLIMPDI